MTKEFSNFQSYVWKFFKGSLNYDSTRPIEILHSNSKYYVGQTDEEGFPFSRLSEETFPSYEAANKAWKQGKVTLRYYP